MRQGGGTFGLLWLGQSASLLGDQLTIFALPWLIATEGGGPLATGALVAAGFGPTLLFGILAGALADRWPRRRAMIACDLARLFLLASIPAALWAGGAGLAQILVVAFGAGLARTLFDPAAQGLLVEILPEERLLSANSRLSVSESVTEVIGPGLAGLLVGLIGVGATLGIDAATFALSALALAMIGRALRRGDALAPAPEPSASPSGVFAGLVHLRADALLWHSTALLALVNLFIGVWGAIAVIFLQRTLGLSGLEAGLVFSINGLGSVALSLICARIGARLGLGRTLVGGTGLAGAGFLVFALAGGFAGAAAGLGLVGAGMVVAIISAITLRQTRTPLAVLGRVSAAAQTLVIGAAAVGALGGGLLGDLAGLRAGLVVAAAGVLATAAWAAAGPLVRHGGAAAAPERPDLAENAA